MKTLILYSSKYGFTKKCVDYLSSKIKGEIYIVNINDEKDINLGYYNNIIIGSPVYMGLINGDLKKYINENIDLLLTKKVYLFLSCGVLKNMDTYLKANFDEKFLNHIIISKCFGGELRLDKLSFIDKMIAKMASKAHDGSEKPSFLKQNVDEFIDEINE